MSKAEKNKIFNNMKNLLNETSLKAEKKEAPLVAQVEKKEIEEMLNIQVFKEITSDEKIINLLMNSSIELFQIQAKNVIELGRVFKNVFDELGGEGSKHTGLYEKWLTVNNISKSTALRYRKRYELYGSIIPSKQSIVALLSQKYIDIIFLEENKNKYIELINEGATVKEIIGIIDEQGIIEVKTVNLIEERDEIFNHIPKYLNFSKEINRKIETLDEKKKRDLQKYLDKIDKILN
ncbi:MAG: hypothetical protein RSB50_08030 [Cetobacterium sp.]